MTGPIPMRPTTSLALLILMSCAIPDDPRAPSLPGIAVSPATGLVTAESGGTDRFALVLSTPPTADVVVALQCGDTSEGSINPSSLTFTPADWSTPQTVLATGMDDALADGNQTYTIATEPASSNDPDYQGLDADDVVVTNMDDESTLGVIDQKQPVTDPGGMYIGGASEQKLAQVVTAGVPGLLLAVRMPIGRGSGSLVIEVQGVAAGKPDGTVLTAETFGAANYPGEESDRFRRFAFSAPVSFTAGSTFAIVLSAPGGSCGILRGPTGNPYPGGSGFFDARPNTPGVWVPLSTRPDLPFMTIVHTQ